MGGTLGSALVLGGGFPAGGQAAHVPLPPRSPPPQQRFPSLGQPANEKRGKKREKNPFVCQGEAWGGGRRKKKTMCGWSARETFDFVFLAILFLGSKELPGLLGRGSGQITGASSAHPGAKVQLQRPPAPSAEGNRFKARRSQEKLKSETVRGRGRAGGTPWGCSERPRSLHPWRDAATAGWEIRG